MEVIGDDINDGTKVQIEGINVLRSERSNKYAEVLISFERKIIMLKVVGVDEICSDISIPILNKRRKLNPLLH